MKTCEHIDRVIRLIEPSGLTVVEVSAGWSKVEKVVHMGGGLLTAEKKTEIMRSEPCLRYWEVDATPHNASEVGFTCDQCSVAMTFPGN